MEINKPKNVKLKMRKCKLGSEGIKQTDIKKKAGVNGTERKTAHSTCCDIS
jgi:hypothetical protein